MTDITELAQSLKAAAEKAIGAHERLAAYPYGEIIDISQQEGEQIDIDITDINEFHEEANPANVLALVEALEKAQQVDEELCKLLPPGAEYMDPPDGGDVTPLEGVRRMVADYRQRIAELESRTVTVKLPDDEDGQAYGFGKWANGKLPATTGTMTISYCEDAWRAAFEVFASAAGIKWEAE
ncbi:ead/Ea22-like family protein [Klebsiella aerogenes]|uniref:ead/Ea22-like family protein n=1 Tax=Klebsiella aerogenes TaxID=548 RepID=UPI0013D3800D|nr:ead/Ea22-like family protein [Klebsiella aerogenes]